MSYRKFFWALLAIASCNAKVAAVGVGGAGGTAGNGVGSGGTGGTTTPDAAANFTGPNRADGAIILEAGTAVPPAAEDLDCKGAAEKRGNVGCRFYATQIPATYPGGNGFLHGCFTMFVVNPGSRPAQLTLDRGGTGLPIAQVTRLPRGTGRNITYAPYDPAVGLPPGELAIVFLSGSNSSLLTLDSCPAGITPATARATAVISSQTAAQPVPVSGVGQAFRLTSDRPVVAYQMMPFMGGDGYGVTSATLLLPVESWGQNHVTVGPKWSWHGLVLVTASEDDTEVSFQPTIAVTAGTGIPATARGMTVKTRLNAGEFIQFAGQAGAGHAEQSSLAASVVTATKPVGVLGSSDSFSNNPNSGKGSSAQQQVPPIEAVGHEYVAIKHQNRSTQDESEPWQLVGIVTGTQLSYVPAAPPGAPTTLEVGQVVQFMTNAPFVVRSQDAEHPFHLSGYMTAGLEAGTTGKDAVGDPEFVSAVSTNQYVSTYTFLTDPTYDRTSLALVRKRGADGQFRDVQLGCAATPVTGWMPVGDFEFTWVSLVTEGYQTVIPGCDNGTHTMTSSAPFAVTVWGWQEAVSYAYPAGAGIQRINTVKPPVIIR